MLQGTQRRGRARPHGFSLVELLMAIFILAIGVISIAAIFPAGIAQQRQSVDDVLGPLVAQNAMTILRGKLRDADFAASDCEMDSNTNDGCDNPFEFPNGVFIDRFIDGDFPWTRPAFLKKDSQVVNADGANVLVPKGSLSIFMGGAGGAIDPGGGLGALDDATNTEVPHSTVVFGSTPPKIIVTPGERAYPMYSDSGPVEDQFAAQYHWECMFRRNQGKVQVAVFVYRVTNPGGVRQPYRVETNPSNEDMPPLPIWKDFTDNGNNPAAAWDASTVVLQGTTPASAYDPLNHEQCWQEPRQWMLDQNANVIRVLGRYEPDDPDNDPMQVELVRPIQPVVDLAVNWFEDPGPTGIAGVDNVVSHIFYIPRNDSGHTLTPVYVHVEDL